MCLFHWWCVCVCGVCVCVCVCVVCWQDARYTALLGQEGSTALDLFKLRQDALLQRLRKDRILVTDIFKVCMACMAHTHGHRETKSERVRERLRSCRESHTQTHTDTQTHTHSHRHTHDMCPCAIEQRNGFEVQSTTTAEEYVSALQNDKDAQSVSAVNMKFIYEYLVERAYEREQRAKVGGTAPSVVCVCACVSVCVSGCPSLCLSGPRLVVCIMVG